jgi:transcriptional regulator of acetoin/glycerol metabolism
VTDATLSQGPRAANQDRARRTHLYLVLEGGRPMANGLRLCLDGISEVRLGRGEARSFSRQQDTSGKFAELAVPDGWMSSKHARLVRAVGQWMLEDLGAKNGTWHGGERITQGVPLSDGARFVVGRSLFLFRSSEPTPEDAPLDADGARLSALHPALRTLNPGLAVELSRLLQIAPTDVPVLLLGESGTGKELAARAIHTLSKRSGAFIAVNAAALPRTLLESQLFGHKRGAFTGADDDREGLLRASHQGTFFLDEVGDLPLEAQPAFLRALQEREVTPVGAARPVSVDFRLVSATHEKLSGLAESGRFRPDLLSRLKGFELRLPPLRERPEDLGLIVAALLEKALGGRPAPAFSVEVVEALSRWHWPLNVRELEQVLTTALALAAGKTVELEHLPAELREAPKAGEKKAAPLTAEDEERKTRLQALMEQHAGNVSAVAREMGTARMQIQRWIKRYGLAAGNYRA